MTQTATKKKSQKKKINWMKVFGILFIVAPIPFLVFILVAYAITGFVISSSTSSLSSESVINTVSVSELTTDTAQFATEAALSNPSLHDTVGAIINVILGFMGFVAVLGIIVGVPIGVILLIASEKRGD